VITICDTGPLAAYLNRNDLHHAWAVELMKHVPPPLPVLRRGRGYRDHEYLLLKVQRATAEQRRQPRAA
jgi:hypothetical protein